MHAVCLTHLHVACMLCAFPVCMLTVLPRSPEQMVEHLMHSPTASSKQRVRQKRWLPPPLPRPDVVDVFEGNGFVSRDARFGQPPPRQVGTVMATTGGGGAPGIWSPRSELAPSPSAPALFRTSPSRAVPGSRGRDAGPALSPKRMSERGPFAADSRAQDGAESRASPKRVAVGAGAQGAQDGAEDTRASIDAVKGVLASHPPSMRPAQRDGALPSRASPLPAADPRAVGAPARSASGGVLLVRRGTAGLPGGSAGLTAGEMPPSYFGALDQVGKTSPRGTSVYLQSPTEIVGSPRARGGAHKQLTRPGFSLVTGPQQRASALLTGGGSPGPHGGVKGGVKGGVEGGALSLGDWRNDWVDPPHPILAPVTAPPRIPKANHIIVVGPKQPHGILLRADRDKVASAEVHARYAGMASHGTEVMLPFRQSPAPAPSPTPSLESRPRRTHDYFH